jgi:hypothetical protein
MRRATNLDKLLTLRRARLRRAERDLAQQQAQCEAARHRSDAASAKVVAFREWQQMRERALLDGLLGRIATLNDIERLRATFMDLDERRHHLERDELEARNAMREAFECKRTLASERDRYRRQSDKIADLVAHIARAARRRSELHAETEQEDCLPSAVRGAVSSMASSTNDGLPC